VTRPSSFWDGGFFDILPERHKGSTAYAETQQSTGGLMQLKNGRDMQIRKARKEDAAELISYVNTVAGESDNLLFGAGEFEMTVEQEENFVEGLASSTTSAFMVGVVDGKIVGVGNITTPKRKRIAHRSGLGMSVLKEYWGLGVGAHIMQALIDFAKASGTIEIIYLKVKADNTRAIALYAKMGFTEVGVIPRDLKIDGQYHDTIIMDLYLC